MVRIGKQVWMAENLAYLPKVSPPGIWSQTDPVYYVLLYYGSSTQEAKSTGNGVLYNFPAAKVSCPRGWHLPTDDDWKEMELALGMDPAELDLIGARNSGSVGKKLKSNEDYIPPYGGDNSSGFNAKPSGSLYGDGRFLGYGGSDSFYWTSTSYGNMLFTRYLNGSDGINRSGGSPLLGYTVRCIK
ncbi:MAG: hypothetical protein A2X22_07870 [Bacteroidetes bacterium GWF2_49_14]|nr:MAG: hypothetical protein A2X22_07870 [Bacteroidetes bacterium GWF2_49_14]